ncbi:MAG: metal-dependent hydrolase [Gammaproteobacteria bacterium]|nr:metal-dependent hydrolase [Gammaproteobacteria bacterium]
MKNSGWTRLCLGLLGAAQLALVSAAVHAVDLQWYGQAAFKITSESGKVILIDPFISKNPKTPEELKDLSKIGNVDLILVTHGHGDHVGDTVELAKMTGAKVAMNADMGHTFGTLGLIPYDQLIRFNKSGPIKPLGDGITITMVPAEHSSEFLHNKTLYPGGEPCGYIVEFENGWTLYHAGDTGVFTEMQFIKDYYDPDLALLPIGGHFTMDPAHAAYAVKKYLNSKAVIPIHYGTFPPLKGTPEQLKAALGSHPAKLIVMNPGDSMKF